MGGESGFILLRIDDDPGKGIKLLPMLVFQKLFIEQFKIGFIPCIGFADKFNALRGSVNIERILLRVGLRFLGKGAQRRLILIRLAGWSAHERVHCVHVGFQRFHALVERWQEKCADSA